MPKDTENITLGAVPLRGHKWVVLWWADKGDRLPYTILRPKHVGEAGKPHGKFKKLKQTPDGMQFWIDRGPFKEGATYEYVVQDAQSKELGRTPVTIDFDPHAVFDPGTLTKLGMQLQVNGVAVANTTITLRSLPISPEDVQKPTNCDIQYAPGMGCMHLSWEQPTPDPPDYFDIRRADAPGSGLPNASALDYWGSVGYDPNSTLQCYDDYDVSIGNAYRYGVAGVAGGPEETDAFAKVI